MGYFSLGVLILDEGEGLGEVPAVLDHEVSGCEGEDSAVDGPAHHHDSLAATAQTVLHFGDDLEQREEVEALLVGPLEGEVVGEDCEGLVDGQVQVERVQVDGEGDLVVGEELGLLLLAGVTFPACWLPRKSPSKSFTKCRLWLLKGAGSSKNRCRRYCDSYALII